MSNLPKESEFELFYEAYSEECALSITTVLERVIQFRVVWENDKGEWQATRSCRVQHNSVLGVYKGGLRLHESVLKLLEFEQIFKNALTGLNIGAGKSGSNFSPYGKRDAERHIDVDIDVPAGDIGFSAREGGYFFGKRKKRQNEAWAWGVTDYGTWYFVEHMMTHSECDGTPFKGKKVAISGSGQVAQFAALKVIELGDTVLSLGESKGALISRDKASWQKEWIEVVVAIKSNRDELSKLGNKGGKFQWHSSVAQPWKLLKIDDNEVDGSDANEMPARGCRYVGEGDNTPCNLQVINIFEHSRIDKRRQRCWYGPGKEGNAGGVAVSGLEMTRNSARLQVTRDEVNAKLQDIMKAVFDVCAKEGAAHPTVY
ncbi:Aminoacid dehydrogenase-like protein [Tilletiaria anomala UBC 951]|uniref:glutamate dehydrogenase (NADP(+)) n=1 Tax=Tilletiaria anomala (strain ATCC 24038 / CBS 436.72 / UBC 951) TaxID=1037660 RepID=A0A066VH35_TILAU|nr:Aminoacid dehydrogenase-like protein [Tilletiaria anomala UBC 951]KDN40786.1 Aminoacid dehydrogenase-like protein [Tilletiaria anomala UBC 951]